MLGNIGLPELIVILILALTIFGASRLSGIGKALGENIRDFKMAVRGPKPSRGAEDEKSPEGKEG